MSARFSQILVCAVALGATSVHASSVTPGQEARELNELRNTVVNLLQALVERGVMTREQAEAMVTSAQKQAAEEAAALDAQEKEDAGAVRVPYVPEIVKDEIRRQVVADLAPEVTNNVVERAKSEAWGIPAALPDWVRRVRWYGDLRVRGQGDFFAPDNLENAYFDYLAINEAGGVTRAGLDALRNVSHDRGRLRGRLRLGVEAELGSGWSLGARLASGNIRDPVSTNETLGSNGDRYEIGIDLGYLRWGGETRTGRHLLSVSAGRFPNPWLGTDLVWDPDLAFDGLAASYRLGLVRDDPYDHFAFVTLGAFPLQELELSTQDKWLYGAQLGLDWAFGNGRARLGLGYYHYDNIVGQRNELDSDLLDFTAPAFLQKGNTLFDIRHDRDSTTNLFALAADYHLADVTMNLEWRLASRYRLALTASYVRNLGLDAQEVFARTGSTIEERDEGYQAELAFGSASLAQNGAWRVFGGYRYLEADAVLDAYTDSDFHLGGTDAKGYFLGVDYAFTPRVWARLRYLSANEIDHAPLGIDLLQFDINAQF